MLSDIGQIKLLLDITDNSKDALFSLLLAAADRAVKNYCKRDLEQQTYTEYYDGPGKQDIALRQRPVTTVTSVNLDLGGFYGDRPGGFASSTLLVNGVDYVLYRDRGGSQSTAGILRRISGSGSGALFYDSGNWQPRQASGTLAARQGAYWPYGYGCVKVVYQAGYTITNGLADLQHAVNEMAVWMYRTRKWGALYPASESLGEYSYSVAPHPIQGTPELGSIRQLLSHYREISL